MAVRLSLSRSNLFVAFEVINFNLLLLLLLLLLSFSKSRSPSGTVFSVGAVVQIVAQLTAVPVSFRIGHWLCVLIGLILVACAAIGVSNIRICCLMFLRFRWENIWMLFHFSVSAVRQCVGDISPSVCGQSRVRRHTSLSDTRTQSNRGPEIWGYAGTNQQPVCGNNELWILQR